ncbi:glycine oxidase ThiO [Alkalihalobacillus sp. 1P02AB]|uniref:glycine oxidase ThiO n=1 Tax=Alkalihalobacillus sp. 1P02AB TaxID=3132260 RepID=UPI0039A6DFA6
MGKEIIVLGGGVIGLSAAFELKKRGFNVTVLEKNKCGGQASGAAAGMLAPLSEIGEDPDDFFKLSLESLRLFADWQNEIKNVSNEDFEYKESGSLHVVYHEADLLALQTRLAWQSQWGVTAELLTAEQVKEKEPELSDEIIAAMYYPEESHVYAPGYVKALEAACRQLGVEIYENLGKVELNEVDKSVLLKSDDGQQFEGDELIICSGAWAKELEDFFALSIPIYPIRGQICAYELERERVRHIVYSSQGYVVPKANGTLVNGASEDIAGFQTDVTEKGIFRLTNWNHHIFSFLKTLKPFHTWAGLRPATQDGYPFIGQLKQAKNVIFAAGHYRNGILLSPITAKIVADLVEGKPTLVPIDRFSPERFS